MDFYLSAQFVLISSSLAQTLDTVAVKQGVFVNITFSIRGKRNATIEMKHDQKVLFSGPKDMVSVPPIDGFDAMENVNDSLIFYIYTSSRNHAGRYCIKDMELETPICVDLLITAEPIISISVKRTREGTFEFFCMATTSTKPADHNLTMAYRWFIDGQYGNVSSTHMIMEYEITSNTDTTIIDHNDDKIQKGKTVACIVTDDPSCRDVLENLVSNSTLKSVLENSDCENVLAHSEKDMFKMEYGPLKLESPGQETFIILGRVVDVMWKIVAFPKPEVALITPFPRQTTSAKIFLTETESKDLYNLTLTIHFISRDDIGTYCVVIKNRKGNITVCQKFLESIPISAKNSSSEVELGKKEVITWTINGNPKPDLVEDSVQVPVGVDRNFVSFSIVNTSINHRYLLTMRTPIISKNDFGRYCVDIRNIKENRTVCHTIMKVSSKNLLLPIVFGVSAFGLLICTVAVIVTIRKMKTSCYEDDLQPSHAEDISLSDVDGSYAVVPDSPEAVDGDEDGSGVPLSPNSQSSPTSLLPHTSFTPSLSTINLSNQPRNSSSSSEGSPQITKNCRNSNCTNVSTIVNYWSNSTKSSLSTNSTKYSLEISSDEFDTNSDHLHAYDSLDSNSKACITSNYASLAK